MIYFVRHGLTEWNKAYKCQGKADISLSSEGINDAKKTKEKLSCVQFDAYFCSPLLRAKQTFNEIVGRFPSDSEIDGRLSERDFGVYEGKTRAEFDFDGFWDNRNFYKDFDAEKLCDFYQRVKEFYDILYNIYSDKNVLVVSHGGVGFIFNSFFEGLPESQVFSHAEIKNGSFKTYAFTK